MIGPLLSFGISIEKSHVILLGLSLHVISLVAFNTQYFLCTFVIGSGVFLFLPYVFGVLGVFCTLMGTSLFRLRKFSFMNLLKKISVPLIWLSSPSSIHIIDKFGVLGFHDILCLDFFNYHLI